MFKPCDIMAIMILKYLLSQSSEQKNLHIQFGAVLTVYSKGDAVGMQAFITCLLMYIPKPECRGVVQN
jgi:hypothetical protein